MRSIGVLLLVALVMGGCQGKHSRTAVQNEEPADAPGISSTVKMNNPATAAQLVKGFYGIEGNSWRWTAREFSVNLKPPLTSAQSGATVTLALTVPDVTIQKAGTVKLTASVGGKDLKTETYSKPGPYTFAADIPAAELTKDTVRIDFKLDKAIPPGPGDGRELGVIAASVGLESK